MASRPGIGGRPASAPQSNGYFLSKKARRKSAAVAIFEDSTSNIKHARDELLLASCPSKPPKTAILTPVQEEPPDSIKPLEKPSRRRTIWIPQDDTTIATIHPGLRDTFVRPELIRIEAPYGPAVLGNNGRNHDFRDSREQARRHSSFRQPKRAPFDSLKPEVVNTLFVDIPGHPTGKENEPEVLQPSKALAVVTDSAARGAVSDQKCRTDITTCLIAPTHQPSERRPGCKPDKKMANGSAVPSMCEIPKRSQHVALVKLMDEFLALRTEDLSAGDFQSLPEGLRHINHDEERTRYLEICKKAMKIAEICAERIAQEGRSDLPVGQHDHA